MKTSLLLSSLSLLATASAHSIFQRVSVNGADQGYLTGVRAPDSDYPIQDVNSGNLACNTGIHSPVSSTVINIPAGAKVGALWQHILGGAQGSNDPDNPIAASHKGPIIVYLAKVSNAATTGTSGLSWFKIAQDTLDSSGKWGVDRVLSQGGWSYFTLPSCIAPGNYLLRVELLALHSAGTQGQAQFYMSCAQINVTGSGTFSGSGFISLPGAYKATDPGILISIYDNAGNPNNGGRSYTAPGGAVQTCPSGGGGGTSTPTKTSSTGSNPTSGTGAPLYGQCGGIGWTGATTCASGTCKVSNEYYSQCLP